VSKRITIITAIAIVVVGFGATAYILLRQESEEVSLEDEFYQALKTHIADKSVHVPVSVHNFRSDFVIDVQKLTPQSIAQAKSDFLAHQECPSQIRFTLWFEPFLSPDAKYDPSLQRWVNESPGLIFLDPDEKERFLTLFSGQEIRGFVFDTSAIGFAPISVKNVIFNYGGGGLQPGILRIGVSKGDSCGQIK
jgi:hypothetical protein